MNWESGLVAALVALISGLLLQPPGIRWLRHRGVMDVPNHRSSHVTLTPRGGGLAVLAALAIGTLVTADGQALSWALVLGCLLLGGVGLVDDLRGLPPKARLGAQLLVGVLAGVMLPAPVDLVVAAGICSVWIASFVNAFNFMDGINGISALTGLVGGASYAAIGYTYGDFASVTFGGALAGASLSFLPFNSPKARVFLGDVGSYALGFAIAALAWVTWAAGAPLALALAPTLVYLADTGSTLIRRWKRGESLTQAHREHVYQELTRGGWSHLATAAFVAAVQGVVTTAAWLGTSMSPWFALLALAALALYLASPRLVSLAPVNS